MSAWSNEFECFDSVPPFIQKCFALLLYIRPGRFRKTYINLFPIINPVLILGTGRVHKKEKNVHREIQ